MCEIFGRVQVLNFRAGLESGIVFGFEPKSGA